MGYVHDTAMSQYIPPTLFHYAGGTWAQAAAAVTDAICLRRTAAAATTVINIPIMLPSNSVALKGAYLKSIVIDYEIDTAAATSITAVLNKVTRGAEGADATVAVQPSTQDLVAATDAADVDDHTLTITVTTPLWIDHEDYFLLELTCVCALTTELDILGAAINFTLRV